MADSTQKELEPLNDSMNANRNICGLNRWLAGGILGVCAAWFIIEIAIDRPTGIPLFIMGGIFGLSSALTWGDPKRPGLIIHSLGQPTHYDPER